MTTYTDLFTANKKIAELDEALGLESLKVIELQGKLDGRKAMIEALIKEVASTRALARGVLTTLIDVTKRIDQGLGDDLRARANEAGFDV